MGKLHSQMVNPSWGFPSIYKDVAHQKRPQLWKVVLVLIIVLAHRPLKGDPELSVNQLVQKALLAPYLPDRKSVV